MQEMWVRSQGQEDPLEEEMATHSSILAWKIPWTKDPGGIQSTGHRDMTEGTEHTRGGDRSSFAFYLIETRRSSLSQETSPGTQFLAR